MVRDIAIVIIAIIITDLVKFILAARVQYSILKRESRGDRRSGVRGSKFKKCVEEAIKIAYTEKMKYRKKH